ncbi:MAG: hypothetical protein KY445_06905, partial [Armatimonadetes bacterium]|nr:hypothetical protein [Armatimonadota bacterium]
WFLECFLRAPFRADGQLSSVYPGSHTVLLDYSLIPLLGQTFWKAETGEWFKPQQTLYKALELKKWYDARLNSEGLVDFDYETLKAQNIINFIDHPGIGWHDFPHPGIDRHGTSCPLNLFFLGFIQILAQIAADVGDSQAQPLKAQSHSLAAAIRAHFFDGEVWHDARDGENLSSGTSWHSNGLAVYFGLSEGEEARRALRAMLARYDDVCRCSPYFHFFFLFALRRAGMENEALELIKREWQPMLEGDATTTWEGFWADAKDSLCHPWSTAPFLFLLESKSLE